MMGLEDFKGFRGHFKILAINIHPSIFIKMS